MTAETFTFAGDESGDVSFSFGKGASRYFVVAAIGTLQPENLRQTLADLRGEARLPVDYEFSFNGLASAKLRRRVFETLARADFESWAVIADKTALPDSFKFMRRLDFYLYFVTELLKLIPEQQREGATLILDEFGAAGQLPIELRKYMKVRGIPRHFRRILAKRSRSEPLIQIADLMAGAVLRRDAYGQAEAFDRVVGKLSRVLEFRA